MKSLLLALTFLAISTASSVAQLITTFGNEGGNFPTPSGGWAYNDASQTLSGDNDTSGQLQQIPGVNIAADTPALSLTASLTSFSGGIDTFTVTLEDLEGDTISAGFNFNDFAAGPQTVVQNINTINPDFDGLDVLVRIAANGTPSSPPNFVIQLGSLVAVPEPTSVTLLLSTAGLALLRRRRRS